MAVFQQDLLVFGQLQFLLAYISAKHLAKTPVPKVVQTGAISGFAYSTYSRWRVFLTSPSSWSEYSSFCFEPGHEKYDCSNLRGMCKCGGHLRGFFNFCSWSVPACLETPHGRATKQWPRLCSKKWTHIHGWSLYDHYRLAVWKSLESWKSWWFTMVCVCIVYIYILYKYYYP